MVNDEDYLYDAAYSELKDRIGDEIIKENRLISLKRYYLLNYELAKSPNLLLDEANTILHDSPTAAFVIAYAVCEVVTRGLIIKPLIYGSVLDHIISDVITEKAMASIRGHAWPLATTLAEKLIKINISTAQYTCDGGGDQITIKISETFDRLSKIRNRIVHRAESVTEEEANECVSLAYGLMEDIFLKVLDSLELSLCDGKLIYSSMSQFDGEWGVKARVDHWAEIDASRGLLK